MFVVVPSLLPLFVLLVPPGLPHSFIALIFHGAVFHALTVARRDKTAWARRALPVGEYVFFLFLLLQQAQVPRYVPFVSNSLLNSFVPCTIMNK